MVNQLWKQMCLVVLCLQIHAGFVTRAALGNHEPLTRNAQVSGSSPLVGSLISVDKPITESKQLAVGLLTFS
jgi:hypothetical protein